MNTEGKKGNKPLGLWNVVSIGIGAMEGAGIFARLGQAAVPMEAWTWGAVSFVGYVRGFFGCPIRRPGGAVPRPA
ncbi:amino acid permease, partial [Escherichia coli]|nr:amino acid permease [Escherichia coli]